MLEDLAFAKDKREGLGKFVYQTPLWSLGVPDSCGYIDMHYCQIDAVPIFAKWGVCVPEQCTIEVRPRRVVEGRMTQCNGTPSTPPNPPTTHPSNRTS